MRQIKFRGKRIDNGELAYGYLYKLPLESGNISMILTTDNIHKDNSIKPQYHLAFTLWKDLFVVDSSTIGQFTGMYDKNGKEIYEGDVVRTMLSEKPFGVVVWHSCGYFYVCENWSANIRESDHLPLGHLMQQVIGEKKVEIEVIGNIYDNPEILKE